MTAYDSSFLNIRRKQLFQQMIQNVSQRKLVPPDTTCVVTCVRARCVGSHKCHGCSVHLSASYRTPLSFSQRARHLNRVVNKIWTYRFVQFRCLQDVLTGFLSSHSFHRMVQESKLEVVSVNLLILPSLFKNSVEICIVALIYTQLP